MIEYVDCSVGLVTCSKDLRANVTAWEFSRPNLKEPASYEEVLAIDAPVNEIPTITLGLYVPIIVRDVLASARDHSMWAQTSRVLKLDDWKICSEAEENDTKYQEDYDEMIRLMKAGVHQDQYRMLLPLTSMTGFTATFSVRSWIKMVKYLEHLSIKSDIGMSAIYNSSKNLIKDTLINTLEVDKETFDTILDKYSFVQFLPAMSDDAESYVGYDASTIYSEVKYSMYAQLIRHRNVQLVSDIESIITNDDIFDYTQGSLVKVGVTASNDVFRSIVKKRNCWLAQTDIWKPFVEAVNKSFPSFEIPCSSGSCPYHGDAIERVRGTDPGLPCPRHLRLNPALLDQANEVWNDLKLKSTMYVGESQRPSSFWIQEINGL